MPGRPQSSGVWGRRWPAAPARCCGRSRSTVKGPLQPQRGRWVELYPQLFAPQSDGSVLLQLPGVQAAVWIG